MIERIIIENFKSIRQLDLELKPINILVGANGAGKSNFLSFFRMANSILIGNVNSYVRGDISKFLYFGRKTSKFFYGLFDISNQITVDFKIAPSFHSNSGFIEKLELRKNSKKTKNKNYEKWKLLFNEESIEESKLTISDLQEVDIILEYFDYLVVHHFQDVSKDSRIKRPSDVNNNHFLKEDSENLASFLYLLQEKHPKEFKNIQDQIRSVAYFFYKFDLEPNKLQNNTIEIKWLEKGSDFYFNAYDLSDGTLRFMALTTLLLQPDLPKTIIIDEPELGLHPFAISKLAAMMKQAAAKGSQVIVSTQSVELVNNFNPEDIIAVDRKDEQSVFSRLDAEELEGWLEDYKLGEIWSKNIFGAMP